MNLSILHPKYFDKQAMDDAWKMGQAIQTSFIEHYYKQYPEWLADHDNPLAFVGMYLWEIVKAAYANQDYDYDTSLIVSLYVARPLPITLERLYDEWCVLQKELQERNPGKMQLNDEEDINLIKAHPMFYVMEE